MCRYLYPPIIFAFEKAEIVLNQWWETINELNLEYVTATLNKQNRTLITNVYYQTTNAHDYLSDKVHILYT